jgi:5-(carboxyamino)imidazole ribonucleotide synthase
MNGTTPPVSLLPGGTAAGAPSDMTVNTTSSNATVEPLTLGVMGGGQLGRMFVHAAQAMGYFTAVLDPDANSPAGRVSHRHIQTDYTDPVGLQQLAMCSAAITTEFENVPAPCAA